MELDNFLMTRSQSDAQTFILPCVAAETHRNSEVERREQ